MGDELLSKKWSGARFQKGYFRLRKLAIKGPRHHVGVGRKQAQEAGNAWLFQVEFDNAVKAGGHNDHPADSEYKDLTIFFEVLRRAGLNAKIVRGSLK